MDFESVGKNIRKQRLTKNLRQEDLAEITNLSVNYIGMIERSEKVPSLEKFIDIANALEISADVLLANVLIKGFEVKNTILNEKLNNVSKTQQNKIYEVIEILLK